MQKSNVTEYHGAVLLQMVKPWYFEIYHVRYRKEKKKNMVSQCPPKIASALAVALSNFCKSSLIFLPSDTGNV